MNELIPDEQGMLVDAIHDSVTIIHKGQRMNQRIIELMLEAGKTIPGDKHIDADFCKKFAELIVRECVAILGTYEETWSYEKQMELLKKYFGVDSEKDTGQS